MPQLKRCGDKFPVSIQNFESSESIVLHTDESGNADAFNTVYDVLNTPYFALEAEVNQTDPKQCNYYSSDGRPG